MEDPVDPEKRGEPVPDTTRPEHPKN